MNFSNSTSNYILGFLVGLAALFFVQYRVWELFLDAFRFLLNIRAHLGRKSTSVLGINNLSLTATASTGLTRERLKSALDIESESKSKLIIWLRHRLNRAGYDN